MVDEIRFSAGEFSTRVRFFSSAEGLLDDVSLALFDTNTRPLLNWGGPELVWPSGEAHKTWPQIDAALERALSLGLARDSVVAGVGGGVVTDMAAFAASLYMRGCRLVLVPTTLLAMVDAALGGKTGIDYHGYKNLVGSFYPASELRIWPGVLATLPERDYRSGLAEVIKHAVLGERELWKLLTERRTDVLARGDDVLNELVYRAILVKVGVVERDFREQGERAHLNLGHTFGHALESVMGFDGTWTHGEAVCWGLSRALALGVRLGVTTEAYRREVEDVLEAYGFRLRASGADPAALLAAMKNDKKKKGGLVRFVLQSGFGATFQQACEDADVLAVLGQGV